MNCLHHWTEEGSTEVSERKLKKKKDTNTKISHQKMFRGCYLVLKAGDTEVEEVQQAVELGHRQVCEPLL